MNKLDITGKDLSTASARERLEFYVQVGKLWLEGKASGGERGIIPLSFPKEHVRDSLKFLVVQDASAKQFHCKDIHPKAAFAHALFFSVFYGQASGSTATRENNHNGLCKEIKLSDTVTAAFVAKSKAISNESKTTKPPAPEWTPRKTGKARERIDYDPFDPLSGILY